MRKFLVFVDIAVALVCWFFACYLIASCVCHIFNFTWSWPAFVIVWAVMTGELSWYGWNKHLNNRS